MGIFGFGSSSTTEQPTQQQYEEDLYSPTANTFEQEQQNSFGLEDSGYEKMPDFMSSISLDANKLQPMSLQGLDFLQIEDSAPVSSSGGFAPSRNWTDDMCYGTGTTYLAGLTLGGAYGLAEGLKKSTGAPRVRLNTTLNTITRRGPGVGNAVGVIAMVYNGANSLLDYSRGTHDIFNSIGAGAAAGALFKSTAGPRAVAISAGVCAGVAGAWSVLVDTLTG
ncbi:Tim17/Tim22/Tim23/Pmp24 family-domain-containing protein [Gilbertella persicaria]|uniref:Mitochondrial import inner membrane translocase subunit tim23 n=1 Tax=Rhizopus stolonifer TaxID=4846 RepID=A0A367IYC0_RHIST|nr:Tim17/Tim22/Tim23/Pmp24 family-domain-containing protein [Gilbertella persicaria]KAI8065335.1 Tim17/Tim22/Tim23/Pmp24 family-domain-containing protein [Gilbertella persicaria]RCH82678.1 Mitochondrial import inner membrane translocase subunit tim23 [Rhizopus stolonifer]